MAAFGGGRPQRPGPRIEIPAACRYALAVSRRTPVSAWIRRSDHPRRPSARTCSRFSLPKTFAIPPGDQVSKRLSTSRATSLTLQPQNLLKNPHLKQKRNQLQLQLQLQTVKNKPLTHQKAKVVQAALLHLKRKRNQLQLQLQTVKSKPLTHQKAKVVQTALLHLKQNKSQAKRAQIHLKTRVLGFSSLPS